MKNTLNFPRLMVDARPFELAALDAAWGEPEVYDYYESKDSFERLEALYLNTDANVGIAVAFVGRTPNNDRFIEIMVPDVSGKWAYAGWLPYEYHDDPFSDGGISYRVETASMNSHFLLSFDNGATRVNFGLSAYGVVGVGRYTELVAAGPYRTRTRTRA